ncbi:hypothetical protein BLOT_010347 [Blomia tropicalis]|nr:hypothetical protein BLOT_010347 [Blomia tropicalis]
MVVVEAYGPLVDRMVVHIGPYIEHVDDVVDDEDDDDRMLDLVHTDEAAADDEFAMLHMAAQSFHSLARVTSTNPPQSFEEAPEAAAAAAAAAACAAEYAAALFNAGLAGVRGQLGDETESKSS